MSDLPDPWPAPRPDGPVERVVSLPGSKSLTNRALVLAAIADGPSVVRRPLRSRDTLLMASALRALGTGIEDADGHWAVTPGAWDRDAEVDCGLAGTVMRFVPPVAGLARGTVGFDGDPHMRLRPVGQMLTALSALGVTVDDGGRGALPFAVPAADPSPAAPSRSMRARRRSSSRRCCWRVPATSTASTYATSASRCRRSPTSR